MSNRVFIIAVSIFIIVILIANGLANANPLINIIYYQTAGAQSSSSPMITTNAPADFTNSNNTADSNFLIYENSAYGIKIQYPSGWGFDENQDGITGNSDTTNKSSSSSSSSSTVQTIVSFEPKTSLSITRINIGVQNYNFHGMTVDLLFNMLMANKAQIFPGMDLVESNSTTLAGSPAHRFVLATGEDSPKILQYVTVKDNKAYIIGYFAKSPEVYSTFLPIAQKMIDSFQIIGSNPTTANQTGNSKYVGNSFSLQYPASWEIQRSEMYNPGSEIIRISSGGHPPWIFISSSPDMANSNITQTYIESHLEQLLPKFITGHIQPQDLNYDKYTVDGHKTGSTIYITSGNTILFKNIFIGTIVGDKMFKFVYSAPSAAFDQNRQTFENVIKSFRFLK